MWVGRLWQSIQSIRLVKAGCEIWLANGITIWADSSADGDFSWRDHFVREWRKEWLEDNPGQELADDINWQVLVAKHPEGLVE